MIFWGLGDFLIQRTIHKVGDLETLFLLSLASSVLLLPFILSDIKTISAFQWLILGILGVVGYFASRVHFLALEKGKLSVVETILGLELPFSVFLGFIFFREKLTLPLVLLIFCVFIGIILISIDFRRVKGKNFLEKGAVLAFISAGLFASLNFFTAVAAQELRPIVVISLPWFLTGVIAFFLLLKKKRLAPLVSKTISAWKLILFMVIIDIAAWLCYTSAVAEKELSITTAITESFVVIAFFLGILYNKEKIKLWQGIGALIAIMASIAIAFF
jgi:drug/metabolite transporter (DMT)-like permease